MNDIQIFGNTQFGSVRITTDENGKTLFCAKDVAAALGYKEPSNAVRQHCKGGAIYTPLQTNGGVQPTRFITEGDVYRLIAQSTLPAAVAFESWLFDEVVPTIAHTGGYQMPMTREQEIAHALISANEVIEEQKATIEVLKPKAYFADAIALTAGINIKDWASSLSKNGVSISIIDAHKWLRDNKITYYKNPKARKDIRAYQQYIDKGWFEYRPDAHTSKSTGKLIETLTVLITGEGQRALTPKILADFGVRNEAAV